MTNGNAFVDLEWKPIEGYEGLYSVSNYGHVLSEREKIKYASGKVVSALPRIMKQHLHKSGYLYIGLTNEQGQHKRYRVHRLVALAFVSNPNNLPEVNHEDYNTQNNVATNLKWCDRLYQNQHGAKKPNRKWQRHRLGKVGMENPKSKPVLVTDLGGEMVGRYDSQCLAAKATNSQQAKISACCLGKIESHNNLKFQFV